MKELLYALPAGMENTGARWNLRPVHMNWKIEPGLKLVGVELPNNLRGGGMYLACPEDPGEGDMALLCRQVGNECRRRNLDRVICDFEVTEGNNIAALCTVMGRACQQEGLSLYLPEELASHAPGCRVLISSAVVNGSLERRLHDALERYGAERVVLAVEAGAADFPLPAAGRGKPLSATELQELMNRLEPAVFFDRGLCAHYFTYMVRGGQAHFILFNTARSVRGKLDTAQRLGVQSALLAAPEVEEWLGEIFS